MRHWLYAEPVGEASEAVWMIYSDDAILASYWPTWMRQGMEYNRAHNLDEGTGINPLKCIEDWVVVHWAVPATEESLLQIISGAKPELINQ